MTGSIATVIFLCQDPKLDLTVLLVGLVAHLNPSVANFADKWRRHDQLGNGINRSLSTTLHPKSLMSVMKIPARDDGIGLRTVFSYGLFPNTVIISPSTFSV